MKKVFLLAGMLAVCTSCTYEDVVNYLTGKQNDLSEQEKEQVNNNMNNSTYTSEVARDRDYGRPK